MTPENAWRTGSREALTAPALVLAIGYVGYGSLAQSQGFSLWHSVLSTICIWALPGQLILIESTKTETPVLAIVLAVVFSASRFLPMTVALMPHLRTRGVPAWRYYFAGHVLAMTSWAVAIRNYPKQMPEARLPYFMGYACTLWTVSMFATAAGFWLAGALPAPLRLAFIFANPLFFILVLTADRPTRQVAVALVAGAVLGPVIHLFAPSWSLIGGGVAGDTIAFLLGERRDG